MNNPETQATLGKRHNENIQKQKMATEKIKTIYHADPTKTKRE